MSDQPFDIRASSFRELFAKALPYAPYVQTGNSKQIERWHNYEKAIQVTDTQRLLIESFKRKMNVLVISGIWCGDCMRQCPMLHRISRCSSEIDLRFIDNQEHPLLRDELRIAGGARVPVAVALSEDFFEVSRFGDRTLSHYRAKAMRELGNACDSGLLLSDAVELQSEVAEWIEFFERSQLILRLSPFLRERYQD